MIHEDEIRMYEFLPSGAIFDLDLEGMLRHTLDERYHIPNAGCKHNILGNPRSLLSQEE